jgi:cytochrome c oxidase subunit 2
VANKAWSILFGVVMLACGIGFAISPWMGWWRPEGVSSHAHHVDNLFDVIMWITAFFFFLTEGILVLFMWQYGSSGTAKPAVSAKAEFPQLLKPLTALLHDQHRVELAWTLVPALILLWIAIIQVETWATVKYESRNRNAEEGPDGSPKTQLAVSARQFEWRIRYPSVERFERWMKDFKTNKKDYDSFGITSQPDDIQVVNELHIWKDHPVTVHLTTRDVIHSFNLPNMRVKQDALPGKMIPVWFKPTRANCAWDVKKGRYVDGINPDTGKEDHDYIYDIPCAELCGWGHYRMIGRVYVHKDQASFLDWLKKTEKQYRPPVTQ